MKTRRAVALRHLAIAEPTAGEASVRKSPRQQPITAIEIDATRAAHLAMMTHCREGAMSVSQTKFLHHVGSS
jgi:hypothetical protein